MEANVSECSLQHNVLINWAEIAKRQPPQLNFIRVGKTSLEEMIAELTNDMGVAFVIHMASARAVLRGLVAGARVMLALVVAHAVQVWSRFVSERVANEIMENTRQIGRA